MEKLIGRHIEIQRLNEFYNSGRAEFVAIYGRRRVGKTFLIDSCFQRKYDFYVSGIVEGAMADQLYNFNQALKEYGDCGQPSAKTWRDAFNALKALLEKKLQKGRILVFIDELPCMDTPRSGFLKAFDSFWNTWASKHPEIMLIVCGSATSWMVENIIDSHGGLHNRISREMHLKPFNLAETEAYFINSGFNWNRLTIAQCYITIGGIPYYLSLLRPQESLAQNIDRLFFSEDGELKREYTRLFHALFRKPEKYMQVIDHLSKSRSGVTRKQLIQKTKAHSGEELTKVLKNLEYCDFIRSYSDSGNPTATNGRIYQIVDFYTLFYLKFCKRPTTDPMWWSHNLGRQVQNDWFGIMFEILCVNHIVQIKDALGISGIYTEYAAWRSKTDEKAKIDLLIDRADGIINICELKYSRNDYELEKAEAEKLMRRQSIYELEAKPRKGIQLVLITTRSLLPGKYSSYFTRVLTLDHLFKPTPHLPITAPATPTTPVGARGSSTRKNLPFQPYF